MIVEYDRSFYRTLMKVNNELVLKRVKKSILELESSEDLHSIKSLKKLSGYKNYYRLRIGDYRLGIERLKGKTVRLLIIAHRKDIYRKFP